MGRKREGARDEITRLLPRFVSIHHGSVLGCFCCFQVKKPQRSNAIPTKATQCRGSWAGGSARVCVAPWSPAACGMQHSRPTVMRVLAPEASRCAWEGLGFGQGWGLGKAGVWEGLGFGKGGHGSSSDCWTFSVLPQQFSTGMSCCADSSGFPAWAGPGSYHVQVQYVFTLPIQRGNHLCHDCLIL